MFPRCPCFQALVLDHHPLCTNKTGPHIGGSQRIWAEPPLCIPVGGRWENTHWCLLDINVNRARARNGGTDVRIYWFPGSRCDSSRGHGAILVFRSPAEGWMVCCSFPERWTLITPSSVFVSPALSLHLCLGIFGVGWLATLALCLCSNTASPVMYKSGSEPKVLSSQCSLYLSCNSICPRVAKYTLLWLFRISHCAPVGLWDIRLYLRSSCYVSQTKRSYCDMDGLLMWVSCCVFLTLFTGGLELCHEWCADACCCSLTKGLISPAPPTHNALYQTSPFVPQRVKCSQCELDLCEERLCHDIIIGPAPCTGLTLALVYRNK